MFLYRCKIIKEHQPIRMGTFLLGSTQELQCAVPENIHTPPTEGIGNSGEEGGSQRPKNLKQCLKLNWNFQRGGGHRANPFRGGYGYFLEPHISPFSKK